MGSFLELVTFPILQCLEFLDSLYFFLFPFTSQPIFSKSHFLFLKYLARCKATQYHLILSSFIYKLFCHRKTWNISFPASVQFSFLFHILLPKLLHSLGFGFFFICLFLEQPSLPIPLFVLVNKVVETEARNKSESPEV